MKQLLTIAICAILFSCGNEKEDIVEQIKAYKDSVRVTEAAEAELKNEQDSLYRSFSDSLKFDFDTKSMEELAKNNKRNMEIEKRRVEATFELTKTQVQKKDELFVKKINFQSKIDSLELELKKY